VPSEGLCLVLNVARAYGAKDTVADRLTGASEDDSHSHPVLTGWMGCFEIRKNRFNGFQASTHFTIRIKLAAVPLNSQN